MIKYSTIRIIPDSSVRNWHTADIARNISNWYKVPLDRVSRKGFKIQYELPYHATFEIDITKEKISFLMHVPANQADIIIKKMQSLPGWEKATIAIDNTYQETWVSEKAKVYQLVYKFNDAYSLHVDAKDNIPLRSICQAAKGMEPGDKAKLFAMFSTQNQLYWKKTHSGSMDKIRQGKDLRKVGLGRMVANILTGIIKEIVLSISVLFNTDGSENIYKDKPIDPELSRQLIENLSPATKRKGDKNVLGVYLWVVSEAEDLHRAANTAKTIAGGFSELTADNELEHKELKGKVKKAAITSIETKQIPKINIQYNIFSTEEAGKIIQLPGSDIQQDFSEIHSISRRETDVNKILTTGGILIGSVTHKGETRNVFLPIKNYDELCLPHVIIGGMGCGKTMGYGANFAVQSVLNNFGSLCIDPAKGEMGNEIEAALPPEKVHRIRLGKTAISLDWGEVKYSSRAKNRLANTVIGFFNTQTDEAGAQTARFIRASVMGMQTGKLSEIMRILEDEAYRNKVIKTMPESLNKITLESINDMSDSRKAQVFAPIYNRLDTILGDVYLAECMESDNNLDMVELMSQKKAIIIDVPKSELGPEAVDLIVNLLSTKIDLAMTLRKEENQFPFFVIFDEPHQFIRSAKVWKSAAVESRKWRVGYVWMFHSWEQIPRQLGEIIKAAGPHYHIYRSSKHTYRELAEELNPFTVEDCLKTPRFYAINVLQAGAVTQKPFMAKMAAPPSKSNKNLKVL